MKIKVRLLLAITLSLLVPALAQVPKASHPKAKQQIQITGIYSDLHYIPEAGDVIGMEIFIVYGGNKDYHAMIQVAEGAPEPPLLVKLKVTGSNVEFIQPEHAGSLSVLGNFKGKITARGLTGKFEKETALRVLKRKNSYWQ